MNPDYDALRHWLAEQAWRRTPAGRRIGDFFSGVVAVLDHEFPKSHFNNRIISTAPIETAEQAHALIEAADAVLEQAGLEHRLVSQLGHAGAAAIEAFEAAGYRTASNALMATSPSSLLAAGLFAGLSHGPAVEEVDESELSDYFWRAWREELPDADDETVRQLVERRCRIDRSTLAIRLASRYPDGQIAGHADLLLRDGYGEIDSVGVEMQAQRRGIGDALLMEAAEIAGRGGVETLLLLADTEDWPLEWYRRRSFQTVGTVWDFTREVPRTPA